MRWNFLTVVLLVGVVVSMGCGESATNSQGIVGGTALLGMQEVTSTIPTAIPVDPTVDIGIVVDPVQMIAAAIDYSE